MSEQTTAAILSPLDVARVAAPSTSDAGVRRSERERRRRRARVVRRVALVALAVAVAAGAITALRPRPVPVDIAAVARAAMTVTVDESGRTRVRDRYLVSAPVGGALARLTLQPGDLVAAGDALARVGPPRPPILDERTRADAEARIAAASWAERQARATVARARIAAEHGRREAARSRTLGLAGSVTPMAMEQAQFEARSREEELAAAELGVRVAAEEVRRARVALGAGAGAGRGVGRGVEVAVRAPISGQVLRLLQQSEAVVQPGTPLLEIGDPAALEVVVDVLTADAVKIRRGARAFVERWGGEGALPARVERIEPGAVTRISALGVEEQRTNVVLALEGDPARREGLGDGFRVEVRIVIWEETAAVTAPASAVFRHGSGWGVYRADGMTARLTPVVVGHRNAEMVEILSGLAPGAAVVLYPGDRVTDGRRLARRGM